MKWMNENLDLSFKVGLTWKAKQIAGSPTSWQISDPENAEGALKELKGKYVHLASIPEVMDLVKHSP